MVWRQRVNPPLCLNKRRRMGLLLDQLCSVEIEASKKLASRYLPADRKPNWSGGLCTKNVDGLAAVLVGAGRCLGQVSRSRGHEHVTRHGNYRQLCWLGCANESCVGLVQKWLVSGNTFGPPRGGHILTDLL
jgi:hypothetical protein